MEKIANNKVVHAFISLDLNVCDESKGSRTHRMIS